MARILYKEGLEGQNRLESIEGIEISLLNGQKAIIYPKYSEEVMLPMGKIEYYKQETDTEIAALKETDSHGATGRLFARDSPAAEFVAQFHSDKYSIFVLPTLLAAMEIADQKNDIDELAETIEGADLLRDFTSYIWSCSRFSKYEGWIVFSSGGFALGGSLCNSYLVVPTILYGEII